MGLKFDDGLVETERSSENMRNHVQENEHAEKCIPCLRVDLDIFNPYSFVHNLGKHNV